MKCGHSWTRCAGPIENDERRSVLRIAEYFERHLQFSVNVVHRCLYVRFYRPMFLVRGCVS
jgi:hypothetical protein